MIYLLLSAGAVLSVFVVRLVWSVFSSLHNETS